MMLSIADVSAWTATADFLAVGSGIAGLCGSIAAREAGVTARVLERSGGTTGSSALASGHFYLGGGTAVQEACGFDDKAEDLAAYLTAVTENPERDKIEAFAAGNVELFNWLEACGIPFDRTYFPSKAVVQPGRECLIWSGNERVWPFCEQARPAPRGHKVSWEGQEGAGGLLMRQLEAHAASIGVEISCNTRVDSLVKDGDRVVGVGARCFGERHYFRAARGVLLAGGGFGRNVAMMERHLKRFEGVNIVGGPYDDGSIIQLGEEAGAALDHMDGILVTSPMYPPEQLLKGILVNREGNRFVAEDSYHTRTSLAIIEQPEGKAYLIVDSSIFAYPEWYAQANQRLIDGFETIAEVEKRLLMPGGALQTTIAAYNRAAREGDDPVFRKAPLWLKPLVNGPWAVFDFSFGQALFNAFTLGGLKTSADAEVIDPKGRAIPGLFAAGACASMLAHDANNYASGISLSAGAFFARQAARRAVGKLRPVPRRSGR